MNKKVIIAVLAMLLAGGGYKTVLAKPKAPAPKPKIEGTVYVLPKEFLVNLADGRYAKVSVGFVMAPDDHSTQPAESGGHGAPSPPEGYGTMPQEAVVRDLVTDTVTDASADQLIDRRGRESLKQRLERAIAAHTDVKVDEVLFTDVAVQ